MSYLRSTSHQSPSHTSRRSSRRASALAAGMAASVLLGAGLLISASASASTSARSAVGSYTTKGAWSFVSAPKLHPPILKVHTRKGRLAPGDFLVANLPNGAYGGPMTGEGGPIIYDNHLRPVWVRGVGTKVGAGNLRQESYLGQPVLVWWQGNVTGGGLPIRGEDFVVDEHYRQLATLKAKSPWVLSLHDAVISGPNIWVTAYHNVSAHYRHWKGKVADAGVQEYNLKTGKLLHTWDAFKKVPLSASKLAPPKRGVWDAYHLNSVQPLADGNLVISFRNTWSVYLVNPTTNKTLWTLGGKKSTFKVSKGAQFAWQHHAELISGTGLGANQKLTLFNDDCNYSPHFKCQGPSEGMIIHLNTGKHTATLVKAYRHHGVVTVEGARSRTMQAGLLGSMQVLPNGNALVGWGSPYSYFTEFSKSGKQLLDVQWPGKDQTYRALYTQTWVGTPYYKPSGAARKAKGKTTVYASWNGATEVAKWQVLGGTSGHLKVVASHTRSGFQTAIALKKSYPTYEVRALNSKGKVLPNGTSKAFAAK